MQPILFLINMTSNKAITFFAIIWALAVLSALIGFYITWGHLPALMDSLMSVTLLAPFALPKSFADILGITSMNSTRGTITTAIIFWPFVIALHWLAHKTKSYYIFLILGITVLVSSYNWFVVGTGMMGL